MKPSMPNHTNMNSAWFPFSHIQQHLLIHSVVPRICEIQYYKKYESIDKENGLGGSMMNPRLLMCEKSANTFILFLLVLVWEEGKPVVDFYNAQCLH